jgi:hypothetical protein
VYYYLPPQDVCVQDILLLMFLHPDLNSVLANDIPQQLHDNERNVKMGPDVMQGQYNGQPIPPDYYYEDSQEGKFHAPHVHGSEGPHQPFHNHPVQGEQENTAVGAAPLKVSYEESSTS